MKKQKSQSGHRMLHSFSRDELYELVEEKGKVSIHLGGKFYGVLKILKKEYLEEKYKHLSIASEGKIFVFSNHKRYDGEWQGILTRESFEGYQYADIVFYNRPHRCWIFRNYKVFPNGVTLYDL